MPERQSHLHRLEAVRRVRRVRRVGPVRRVHRDVAIYHHAGGTAAKHLWTWEQPDYGDCSSILAYPAAFASDPATDTPLYLAYTQCLDQNLTLYAFKVDSGDLQWTWMVPFLWGGNAAPIVDDEAGVVLVLLNALLTPRPPPPEQTALVSIDLQTGEQLGWTYFTGDVYAAPALFVNHTTDGSPSVRTLVTSTWADHTGQSMIRGFSPSNSSWLGSLSVSWQFNLSNIASAAVTSPLLSVDADGRIYLTLWVDQSKDFYGVLSPVIGAYDMGPTVKSVPEHAFSLNLTKAFGTQPLGTSDNSYIAYGREVMITRYGLFAVAGNGVGMIADTGRPC